MADAMGAARREEIEVTTADGLRLRGVRAMPAQGRAKATIVLAHGYGEHIGRYEHVIDAMTAARFGVYAVDQRGYGRSDGSRAIVDRFDRYVDDLALVTALPKAEHADRPLFVLGHSMGGLVAARYAMRHQAELAGLVLMSPALSLPNVPSRVEQQMLRLMARVAPETEIPRQGPTGRLSTDLAVDAGFLEDPLCYNGRPKAGFAIEIFDAGNDARSRLRELTVPMLAMHGEDDEVIPIAGSHQLNKQASSPDRTLITWPGLRHELFNEVDRAEVINVVLSWLNAHHVAWLKARDASADNREVVLQPANTPPVNHH
jgi:acylglycerol lipase